MLDHETKATGWTIDTLFHHFTAILNEKEKRYSQRFEAQEKALLEAKSNKGVIWAYFAGAIGLAIALIEFVQRFGKP